MYVCGPKGNIHRSSFVNEWGVTVQFHQWENDPNLARTFTHVLFIIVLVYVKFNRVLEIGKSTSFSYAQLIRVNWFGVGTNLLPIDSSNSDGFTLTMTAAHTPIDTVFSFCVVHGLDEHWSESYSLNVRRIQSSHKHRTNNMDNNFFFFFHLFEPTKTKCYFVPSDGIWFSYFRKFHSLVWDFRWLLSYWTFVESKDVCQLHSKDNSNNNNNHKKIEITIKLSANDPYQYIPLLVWFASHLCRESMDSVKRKKKQKTTKWFRESVTNDNFNVYIYWNSNKIVNMAKLPSTHLLMALPYMSIFIFYSSHSPLPCSLHAIGVFTCNFF